VFSRLFLIFSFLILLASCGGEETTEPIATGTINGFVYDGYANAAIDTAEVITNPPSSAVITDDKGEYKILNVEPGVYRVTAYKMGYDSAGVYISVSAGNTTIADIPLLVDTSQVAIDF
jgi:hypothetical protein